jgi:predicted  nucleic acid-binding Zn-ribbon protein
MTTSKLITELKVLEKRREEIASEAGKAQAAYATSQQSMMSGAIQVSDLTTAHSASHALQTALSSLDSKIEEARAEIRAAKATEEAEALKARVSALTAEARAARDQHAAIARAAWQALGVAANEMLDARARYLELSRQVAELDGLGLGFPEWQNIARGDQDFGPLVIQAALIAAQRRENVARHVVGNPLQRGWDSKAA